MGRPRGRGTGPREDQCLDLLFDLRLDQGAARSAQGSVFSALRHDLALKRPPARSGFPASARTGHSGLLFYSLRMRLRSPPPPFSSLLAAFPARRHALKSVLDRAVRCEPRAGEGATSVLAPCPARVSLGPEDAGGAL